MLTITTARCTMVKLCAISLAPPTQGELLATTIRSTARWPHLSGAFALREESAALAASSGEATELAMFHDWLADPINTRIVTNDFVKRIHHNDLVPLVHCIRGDPIGIEHAKASTFATDALFSNATEVAASLDLVDTLVSRLSIHDALGHTLLTASTLHSHTVNQVALLRLVSKLPGFVSACWSRCAVNRRQLPELPCSDTLHEAHHIGLLLPP
mmetsp:Transcript_119697/g.186943  ORF Transcript_119697/g.186943 Transcript_119697/m.186943 type:complete len:214 (+) Transcript_119697:50-691(+)